MNITLSVDDILSTSDKEEIARDCYRAAINQHLIDEGNIMRVLDNYAYTMVWRKVDEVLGKHVDLESILVQKTRDIFNNMSEFSIFRKPNAWDREENSGYQLLERCLLDNKELLNKRVQDAVGGIEDECIAEMLAQAMVDLIKKR